MKLSTDDAILLDVADLQETDRIVCFLTRRHGKKRGVAGGAKRRFSRFLGQLQPLSRLRVTWFEKEGRELVRVREAELVRSADKLQRDLEGILAGCYLAELVSTFAPEGQADEPLFRLLDSALDAMLTGADRDVVLRYAEAWVLRLAGIFPAPVDCPRCGEALGDGPAVLPPVGDGVLCARCAGGRQAGLQVGPGELAFLRRIGRQRPEQVAEEATPPEILRSLERIAAAVRRGFLQEELKSYTVLRRTLGEELEGGGEERKRGSEAERGGERGEPRAGRQPSRYRPPTAG